MIKSLTGFILGDFVRIHHKNKQPSPIADWMISTSHLLLPPFAFRKSWKFCCEAPSWCFGSALYGMLQGCLAIVNFVPFDDECWVSLMLGDVYWLYWRLFLILVPTQVGPIFFFWLCVIFLLWPISSNEKESPIDLITAKAPENKPKLLQNKGIIWTNHPFSAASLLL